jgi:gliding motility-associated lipoprotein GldH
MTKRINYLFLLTIIAITACDVTRYYDTTNPIPKQIWHKDSVYQFPVAIKDSSTTFNIFLNLRHSGNYPFMNIIFFVNIQGPDNQFLKDTVAYDIAQTDGRWIGTGLGDLHSMLLPYKKNIRFPQNGQYYFSIQHAMRVDELKGVSDIGIRIEKIIP